MGTAHCVHSGPLQEFIQAHSALLPPSLVEHLPPFWHGLGVHGSLLSAVAKNDIFWAFISLVVVKIKLLCTCCEIIGDN